MQEFVTLLAVSSIFTFVRHKNHFLVELAHHARKLLVKLGNAHADIDHKEHQVSLFDGVKNLGTDAIGQDVDRIVWQEASRIDHRKFVALVIRSLVMPIASHAIAVRHDSRPAAQDAVKERGLSDIRTSNNAYDR